MNSPFLEKDVLLSAGLRGLVQKEAWQELDQALAPLAQEGGIIFETLKEIINQKRIEYIVSVRDARSPYEEDGIWHDDGSRPLAFSLGLTLEPSKVQGGVLQLRKKGEESGTNFGPLPFGRLCIFKTGVDGFEHRVLKVEKGLRVVMAGWCYLD